MIIRAIYLGDVSAYHRLCCSHDVQKNVFSLCDISLSAIESYIKGLGDHDHLLVAESCGNGQSQLIGAASLHIRGQRRTRHSGYLTVMVHPSYRGRGVGRSLITHLLDLADNWLMVVRLDIDLASNNKAAVRLFTSRGFEVEGIRKLAAFDGHEYCDVLTMARYRLFAEDQSEKSC